MKNKIWIGVIVCMVTVARGAEPSASDPAPVATASPPASVVSLLPADAEMPYASVDEVAPAPYADRLTGDWHDGARSKLAAAGIEVFAYYNAIFAGNVTGGIRGDSDYAGDLYFGAVFDLETIAGISDTTLTLSGINRHGHSIDAAVGGKYSVMQLVGGQTTFLYNVVLERLFLDGDLSVKLGRMTATDDFVGSELYAYSLNNAVNGQIRAVLFDNVMSSYPFAAWGGRVKAKVSDELTALVGVFQIGPDMFDPGKHGLDLSIRRSDGLSLFTQLDWETDIGGRPARFFAGMNNVFIQELPEFNTLETTRYFVRFYAHGDVQLWSNNANNDRSLKLFATLAYAPDDQVAIMPVQSTIGLHYKGLFPQRENDRTVFFATYGGFSDAYSDAEVAAGRPSVDYEMVFEVGHRFQITPWCYAQPSVQYIHHPGGTGDIQDALVLGVQAGVSF